MRNADREAILKEKGFLTGRPRLSEIPFEDIQVADRVFSGFTGVYGYVRNKVEKTANQDDNTIIVDWDQGSQSRQFHFDYDGVEYLGHK